MALYDLILYIYFFFSYTLILLKMKHSHKSHHSEMTLMRMFPDYFPYDFKWNVMITFHLKSHGK